MVDDLHANCISRQEHEAVVSQLRAEIESLRKIVESLQARYEGPHVPPSISGRYPKRKPTGNRPGKPNGAPGATRKLEHKKPDETIPVKREFCPKGHKLGEKLGIDTRMVMDVPKPVKPKLREFQLGVYYCPECDSPIVATHPDCPTEGEVGPAALSLIQDLRIKERLSIAMVRSFLKARFGLELSERAIIDATSRTADLLKTEHNELLIHIRNAFVVYVDETGYKLNGKRIWMWVFATGKDILVVLDESRGSGVPRRILGDDFRGVVVSDCYSAYELFAKHATRARYQKCWAHPLREAERLAEKYEEGKELYAKLRDWFGKMREFIDGNPPQELRESFYKTALDWLDELVKWQPAEKLVARVVRRLAKYRECWFTCILVPGVEPTNNTAERALRPQVILRRLRGGFRSQQGLEDHERLASLMTTWELRGLDPTLQLEAELSEIFAEGGIM